MNKPIKNFPSYVVSKKGSIFRVKDKNGKPIPARLVKPRLDRYGYYKINLSEKGKTTTLKVHRVVAEAFIPNPKRRNTVNHINGNKKDNRVENLEWLTRRQNLKLTKGMKRKTISKRHRQLEAKVETIRKLIEQGIIIDLPLFLKIMSGEKK